MVENFIYTYDGATTFTLAGSDMTELDYTGNSPFHVAIEEEAVNCVAEILRFMPKEIMEYTDAQKRTAIVHAAQKGNANICQLLIQAGANLDTASPDSGRTPLHIAAEINSGIIVELLLRGGAQVGVLDLGGLTPVHIASIVEGTDALNTFANAARDDILNLVDAGGMTPLMQSCAYGNESNVKILLRKRVSLCDRLHHGITFISMTL